MRANRAPGRTWSAAAAASGNITIRSSRRCFPTQLKGVGLDKFYRAINKVERSLIRTDADEVTYNLHVMLRFDLELQMLEGKLEIKDLPEAWHARYKSDLGIQAPSDVNGALQDVHWYAGSDRWRLPRLHARQYHERPVLRRGAQSSSADPEADRQGRVQYSALHGSRTISTRTARSIHRLSLSNESRADRCALSRISSISRPNTESCTSYKPHASRCIL